MSRMLLTITLVLWVPALAAAAPKKERKPSPFAPSLPQLTDDEEEEIDRIVDRFTLYDIGRLRGEEGKQALRDFENLGPEAIFGLIRGLNRAAHLEASCPVLTIGRKVAGILRSSNDPELLEFARENIGAGNTQSRHVGLLRELRVMAMVRKRAVLNTLAASKGRPTPTALHAMTTFQLNHILKKERGPARRSVLTELATRRGDEVVDTLEANAADAANELRPLARSLLVQNLSALSSTALKGKLSDERPEVRLAAVKAAQRKGYRLGGELIGLLNDANGEIRGAAHTALVKLNKGKDLGPAKDATDSERISAVEQWQAWWVKQNRR